MYQISLTPWQKWVLTLMSDVILVETFAGCLWQNPANKNITVLSLFTNNALVSYVRKLATRPIFIVLSISLANSGLLRLTLPAQTTPLWLCCLVLASVELEDEISGDEVESSALRG